MRNSASSGIGGAAGPERAERLGEAGLAAPRHHQRRPGRPGPRRSRAGAPRRSDATPAPKGRSLRARRRRGRRMTPSFRSLAWSRPSGPSRAAVDGSPAAARLPSRGQRFVISPRDPACGLKVETGRMRKRPSPSPRLSRCPAASSACSTRKGPVGAAEKHDPDRFAGDHAGDRRADDRRDARLRLVVPRRQHAGALPAGLGLFRPLELVVWSIPLLVDHASWAASPGSARTSSIPAQPLAVDSASRSRSRSSRSTGNGCSSTRTRASPASTSWSSRPARRCTSR